MGIIEEMVDANPSALIDLYELDVTGVPNFEAFDYEKFYDITPANDLYVETNWEVMSDVFYSPRLEDLSDWTLLVSGKSWNTVNTDVTGYLGVTPSLPPATVGQYYMDIDTAVSYLLSDYTNGSYIDPSSLTYSNYGEYKQDGTYTTDSDSIELSGTTWIAAPYTYTITADTVIEVEYSSTEQGLIHAIGLDGSLVTGSAITYVENYLVNQPDTPSDAGTNFYAVSPNSICFDSSGQILFVSRKDTGKIYAYHSTLPYTLSDLYHYPGGYELDISSQDSFAPGMSLVNNDLTLFVSGYSTNKIYKYDLSSAGDIRTATYSGQSFEITTGDIGATNFNLQGIHVTEAGTNFYITINGYREDQKIYQFSMGTAYNLTTTSYEGKGDDTLVSEPQDVYMSPDGLKVFQVSYNTNWVWEFDLSVAEDITTATFNNNPWDTAVNYQEEAYYTTSKLEEHITGITFSANGLYMFLVGNTTDMVHKFNLRSAFNTDSEQTVDSENKVIQLSGYDNYGIDYKIYDDDDLGTIVHAIIPVGSFYTGAASYLFFGITTSDTKYESANSTFKNIAIYDKVSANFEPITRTTKESFPTSCLVNTFKDKVVIFDTSEADRQMWMTIDNHDTNIFTGTPELKFSDTSSGMLYIGTDTGIYEYDFILDTVSFNIESTTIYDLKTTMTLEGTINTSRLNQPIPVLVYIDDGELKVRKHIDGSYVEYTPVAGTPTNFVKVEITANRELYVFTSSDRVYYFGLIQSIGTDFTFITVLDYVDQGQQDVSHNGIISANIDHITLATKNGLYAEIGTDYSTGYYTPETYNICASFDTNTFDGTQVIKNPNFQEGSKYYIYGYGWEYSNSSMIAIDAYSAFYQTVSLPSIEEYIVTVHVSDVQTGSLSLIIEPQFDTTNTEDDVIIQYILDGTGEYINNATTRYIKPNQENVYEERDITGEGVFSFLIPTRSYDVSILIMGNNFTGTVNSVKMHSKSSFNAINRKSNLENVEVYGPLTVSPINAESNMVKYTDGTFYTKVSSEEVYIYYWEFDGISWKFIYHEGYSSNVYEGIYYIDCTMPKALIRLSGTKYTDTQLATIRVNELRLFIEDSNVLLQSDNGIGYLYDQIHSICFDDRTGYYYTQMYESYTIQKFKDLVCLEEINVESNSLSLNAYNSNITINNSDSYDIRYLGDGTEATHGGDIGIHRFYDGTNQFGNPIIWKGKAYQPWPIKVEGYELSGDSEIPRPTLTAANIGFVLSDLIYKYDDILGAKVSRKRTFAKYLDSINFIGGNLYADSTIEFPDTVFYINKKISETFEMVSFELTSQWDLEGIKLPRRLVTYDTCRWQYKDGSCGYSGDKYFDVHGNEVLYEDEDVCGKHLNDCLKRFTDTVVDGQGTNSYKIVNIPFGGFPGVGL